MSESSTPPDALIQSLNARIEKLTGENTRRKAAVRTLTRALGVRDSAEAAALLREIAELGDLRQVIGDYKTLKASPDQLQAENARLQAELRTIKHKEGFRTLYEDRDLGLNPEVPVDRLMKLVSYRPESETFDPQAVRAEVANLRATDPYLFRRSDAPPPQAPAPATPQPQAPASRPAWAARGAAVVEAGAGTGDVTLTPAQFRDPAFMCGPGASIGMTKDHR